ncbi:hypothetical protein [Accumulibacter sp.]|uniref:hypothetical protein n=1 Tax=Accumulibacter sp. TaxID=2053492 RepID=UPI0028C47E7E|nr:hypothetical protein [Accumulibacter sp.]
MLEMVRKSCSMSRIVCTPLIGSTKPDDEQTAFFFLDPRNRKGGLPQARARPYRENKPPQTGQAQPVTQLGESTSHTQKTPCNYGNSAHD